MLLPQQEIKDGVVRLRVVEVKLGGIRTAGGRGSSTPHVFEQRVTGISSVGPALRVAYRSNVSLCCRRATFGFVWIC